ncbi:MAG: histone deacetylase family protein [Alphaproteobacteria bacterium]|nr:histone deacetylase family protein [Alphaproteobacteria bacterium]
MTTTLFTHSDCLAHSNGPGHPERPERLAAVLAELGKPDYDALIRHEAPLAAVDQIARVHDRAYIEGVLAAVPKEGIVDLNEDTALAPGSGNAALRAAGALVAAVDLVLAGKIARAFCAVRPPGHHAGRSAPSGFCIFNNIAIGAEHAFQAHGLKRAAILDIDVHHGNGTQAWAENQPNVLFCSSHQWPLWPGSGAASDRGPLGNIVNIPLAPGTGGAGFREAMQTRVLPAFDAFKPELVMMSVGFDAHRGDPLADMRLDEDDYYWITAETCRLAKKHCAGRVISTLEGGYNVTALAASAGAHVKALMEG